MRRHIIILLLAIMAFPVSIAAQDPWYIFPGSHKKTGTDTTAVKKAVKEVKEANVVKVAGTPGQPVSDVQAATDSTATKCSLKTGLILPLSSQGTPSSNFLDFYCGVLLAADEYSKSGVPSELVVYDSTTGLPGVSELKSCQLVIGPVGLAEMESMVRRCPDSPFLISPLDPKVAEMTATNSIIQAPANWDAQVDELAAWLSSETGGKDLVILLQSSEEAESQMTSRMAEKLSEAGITFLIAESAADVVRPSAGRTRFVLLSENDSYIGSQVREIALMNITDRESNPQSDRVVLYGTSRIRNSSDLDQETLYSTATRMVSNYHVDNSAKDVKAFVTAYKAMFKAEPTSFAYQGYDIMKYFSRLFAEYGTDWAEHMEDTPYSGLHADFRFISEGRTGKINTAVRRVIYNYDNTTTLAR